MNIREEIENAGCFTESEVDDLEMVFERALKERDKVIEESLRLLTIAKDQSCGCIDHYLTDIEDFIQEAMK